MAALFFMLFFGQPMVDPVGDLSGIYHVKGHEPAAKGPYEGMVWVRGAGQGVYHVQYSGNGNNVEGVALRTGDTLSVSWLMPSKDGPRRGLSVYHVNGKTLSGRWIIEPNAAIVRETMTLLRPLEVE
jgi:hypothetical protein